MSPACSTASSSASSAPARASASFSFRSRPETGRETWRKMPIGVGPSGVDDSRDSANASDGSSRCASWTTSASSPTSATARDPQRRRRDRARRRSRTRRRSGSAAVLQRNPVDRALLLVAQRVERAVVEHRAVLVDLDQRRALVLGRGPQHRRQVVLVGVDRARHERRLGAQRQRHRVERRVDRPERRRLRHLAELRRRRRLPLGQPVDLVVEEQDLHRHVAAQRVDQVVAADAQRVAVTGHDPDREVLARGRQPGRQRGPAPVDAVHPVRVHVVREAARAADAGHEHDPLGRDPELREEGLHGREHRVVAAARAPARLLVGLEVRLRQPRRCHISFSISDGISGWPCTFPYDSTLTR